MSIDLSRAVADMRNEIVRFFQDLQNKLSDREHIELVTATKIEHFAFDLLDRHLHDFINARAGVLHEEPIADRAAIAMYRQWLFEQRACDKSWYNFFEMLLGSVLIERT